MHLGFVNKKISGWGRYPRGSTSVFRPERSADYASKNLPKKMIARGSGLSYGDGSFASNSATISTKLLNKILAFDPINGTISCQSGVTLEEIIEVSLSHGWFLPVTPGTARVTAGGCAACDVHGKNHHVQGIGSFGNHIRSLQLLLANGDTVLCSKNENTDIFFATIGGMGLTGIIMDLTIQLTQISSTAMCVQNRKVNNLEEMFSILEEEHEYSHCVAWLDSNAKGKNLGRGVVMFGEHSRIRQPMKWQPIIRRSLPFSVPSIMLNKLTSYAFNSAVEFSSRNQNATQSNLANFFYPLDTISNWNLLYGRLGFVEYQVVVPEVTAYQFIEYVITEMQKRNLYSFLTSMKRMGPASGGLLSFPMPGYSFSIDLPMADKNTISFLDSMDEKLLESKGRVYLAKDARLKAGVFNEMYPSVQQFLSIKKKIDPDNRFSSDLSVRLGLD